MWAVSAFADVGGIAAPPTGRCIQYLARGAALFLRALDFV
jgi:hypothetical protein